MRILLVEAGFFVNHHYCARVAVRLQVVASAWQRRWCSAQHALLDGAEYPVRPAAALVVLLHPPRTHLLLHRRPVAHMPRQHAQHVLTPARIHQQRLLRQAPQLQRLILRLHSPPRLCLARLRFSLSIALSLSLIYPNAVGSNR